MLSYSWINYSINRGLIKGGTGSIQSFNSKSKCDDIGQNRNQFAFHVKPRPGENAIHK